MSSNLIFGTINQRVAGSSPAGGASKRYRALMPEVIGTDLKVKLPLIKRATL